MGLPVIWEFLMPMWRHSTGDSSILYCWRQFSHDLSAHSRFHASKLGRKSGNLTWKLTSKICPCQKSLKPSVGRHLAGQFDNITGRLETMAGSLRRVACQVGNECNGQVVMGRCIYRENDRTLRDTHSSLHWSIWLPTDNTVYVIFSALSGKNVGEVVIYIWLKN